MRVSGAKGLRLVAGGDRGACHRYSLGYIHTVVASTHAWHMLDYQLTDGEQQPCVASSLTRSRSHKCTLGICICIGRMGLTCVESRNRECQQGLAASLEMQEKAGLAQNCAECRECVDESLDGPAQVCNLRCKFGMALLSR